MSSKLNAAGGSSLPMTSFSLLVPTTVADISPWPLCFTEPGTGAGARAGATAGAGVEAAAGVAVLTAEVLAVDFALEVDLVCLAACTKPVQPRLESKSAIQNRCFIKSS